MAEQAPKFEARLPEPEHELLLPTAEQAEPLRPGEADPVKQLEAARSVIEQTAESSNPVAEHVAQETAQAAPQSTHVNQELKTITLRRELQHIRRQLPAPDRVLSKVIHQPVVRATSEAVGNSLSRPSGLLGGGLVAFIGSASYLYLAKHIGFSYNYLLFFFLFIAGFALGLFLELLVWAATARRRHALD